MHNPITVSSESIRGINVTTVQQTDCEFLRTAVVVPFNPVEILNGSTPHEVPHMLEHVLLSGNRDHTTEMFHNLLTATGGNFNGYTTSGINGYVAFETTQPDTGVEQSALLLQSVLDPALQDKDTDEQLVVVKNELSGYLQNPVRQRYSKMRFEQGTSFRTDASGINSLAQVTTQKLTTFHKQFFSKANTRVVFSGSPLAIQQAMSKLAMASYLSDDAGTTHKAANGDLTELIDYHADAAEIPDGSTEYYHARVYNGDTAGGNSIPEFEVIADAFYDYIATGHDGISMRSRSSGLSYGTRVGWMYGPQQYSLSVSDTTPVSHVAKQVELLNEALDRTSKYAANDFEQFFHKRQGTIKMYSPQIMSFAKSVERAVAMSELEGLTTPDVYRKALEHANPAEVVAGVKSLADNMQVPSFVRQHSFGNNPFEGSPKK